MKPFTQTIYDRQQFVTPTISRKRINQVCEQHHVQPSDVNMYSFALLHMIDTGIIKNDILSSKVFYTLLIHGGTTPDQQKEALDTMIEVVLFDNGIQLQSSIQACRLAKSKMIRIEDDRNRKRLTRTGE